MVRRQLEILWVPAPLCPPLKWEPVGAARDTSLLFADGFQGLQGVGVEYERGQGPGDTTGILGTYAMKASVTKSATVHLTFKQVRFRHQRTGGPWEPALGMSDTAWSPEA